MSGPAERVVGHLGAVSYHEIVSDEAVPGQKVRDAGVPVKDGEQVVEHDDRAEEIWVVRVAFRAVQERPEAVDLDEAEAAEDGVVAEAQVENVERK